MCLLLMKLHVLSLLLWSYLPMRLPIAMLMYTSSFCKIWCIAKDIRHVIMWRSRTWVPLSSLSITGTHVVLFI
jgi:hypothetical protein